MGKTPRGHAVGGESIRLRRWANPGAPARWAECVRRPVKIARRDAILVAKEELPMTEAEWNVCTDPQAMLTFLQGNASDRKLRLFAVACWLRRGAELPDQRAWEAVLIAERYAEHQATDAELRIAHTQAEGSFKEHREAYAAVVVSADSALRAATGAVDAVHYLGWEAQEEWDERTVHVVLLRDIFGPNPFCSTTLDSSWFTSTVAMLANSIYTDRAFDRLPILADALEDAGCTNRDILDHCRQPGEHVRGCWVVDLVLGKS
jgi:hypothetical protein